MSHRARELRSRVLLSRKSAKRSAEHALAEHPAFYGALYPPSEAIVSVVIAD